MLVSRFAREGLLAKSCPSWPGSVNRGEKVVIKLFNGAQWGFLMLVLEVVQLGYGTCHAENCQ